MCLCFSHGVISFSLFFHIDIDEENASLFSYLIEPHLNGSILEYQPKHTSIHFEVTYIHMYVCFCVP